jgi:four helix bundle protein
MSTDGKGYSDPLQRVAAYRLALEMIDEVRQDAQAMKRDVVMREVAGQLLRAAGSVSANIAEGYARVSVADRRRFYEYALGSAREVDAWYRAAAQQPRAETAARLLSIRRLLLTMIRNVRENTNRARR